VTDVGVLTVIAAVAAVAILVVVRRRREPHGETKPAGPPASPHLGAHVLVGVGRPRSAPGLGRFAAALARPEDGAVTPLTVLSENADETTREGVEATLREAERAALQLDVDAAGKVRVAASAAEGILHASVESDASAIVLGWPATRAESEHLGYPADRVVADAPCPVLIARLDADRWTRVLLHASPPRTDAGEVTPDTEASLQLAVETMCRLAQALDVPAATTEPVQIASRWAGSVQVDVDRGADTAGLLGVADELAIVPVAPSATAIDEVVRRARPVGDLVLALSHGIEAQRRRPLLPSAQELLDSAERTDGGAR
jgi:hypothetical protein